MSEYIDPKTGMKIRKLTELKATAAKEYQEAMLQRVDHFAKKGDSIFNNQLENFIVKGLGGLLNLKVKVDEMLGEDLKLKVHSAIDKILLTF